VNAPSRVCMSVCQRATLIRKLCGKSVKQPTRTSNRPTRSCSLLRSCVASYARLKCGLRLTLKKANNLVQLRKQLPVAIGLLNLASCHLSYGFDKSSQVLPVIGQHFCGLALK
jgi:hypothetical protein